METKVQYISSQGKAKLEAELKELKSRRPAMAERIAIAKELGDLSENADYEDARRQQSFLEGRIQEIEAILNNHQIIEQPKKGAAIDIGSTVSIELPDGKMKVLITGPAEAKPSEGRLSYLSPLGQALRGQTQGATVEVSSPDGRYSVKITDVK